MDESIIYKGQKRYVKNKTFYFLSGNLASIEELEGLAKIKNLEILNLTQNKISRISGLEQLKNLKCLNLRNNQVEIISGLEYSKNLEELDLHNNQIREISGFDNLQNLKILSLEKNQIEKISGLDNLQNLEHINLRKNQIKKIENLDKLKKLKKLELSLNPIKKIENLESLENLEILYIGRTNIQKIENLEKNTKLKTLIVDIVPLKEIEGLSKLKALQDVRIRGSLKNTDLTWIEGIEHLINLKQLDIDVFYISREFVSFDIYPIILRFVCMVKNNNYKSIKDWKTIFKEFPKAFDIFDLTLPKIYYIEQMSENLLNIITKILNNSEYEEIKKDQEKEWWDIYYTAERIFSEKRQEKLEIIKKM
jgi:hypothetical protein